MKHDSLCDNQRFISKLILFRAISDKFNLRFTLLGMKKADEFLDLQSSSNAVGNMHRRLSSLESLFCYDKSVPEEIIEKPVGLSLGEKDIGNKRRCPVCEAKGAVLCATCSGSGLYVDSIMESQGIIVKVRCLGCGGTGNIMCSECGGRGHGGVS